VIDPTCLLHGLKRSEHDCLYCTLCFKDLTPETCFVDSDGVRWDICPQCEEGGRKYIERMTGKEASDG
jgi:hypothetical protein